MIGRLLIDECLSPELAQLAIDAGHALEVHENEDGLISVNTYDIPPPHL